MTSAPGESRTKRSVRNAGVGVLAQSVVILLGFVTRSFFLHHLGVELLGVQTALTGFLALLAVADFGFSSALMYTLYAPLAAGDHARVAAVVRHAARLYRWVALVVALLGLSVVPLLGQIISAEHVEHLTVYYLVMLAGSVAFFPLYHRVVLIEADQKAYVTKWVTVGLNVVRAASQIAVLVLWQSFVAFLAIQVVMNVLINVVVHLYVGRHYRYLATPGELTQHDRRDINRSVRAMFVYRVSGLALNNTGPVVIASLLGVVALGYWSNYMLVIGSCVMLLEVAFAALTPSVGNLVASGDRSAVRRVLDEMQLLAMLLYGAAAVALIAFTPAFIGAWLGADYQVSLAALVCAAITFYVAGAIMPVTVSRSATGMFREARYVLALAAVLNLLLSVALGLAYGLPGVLIAPTIARLATNVWLEPWFLFRSYIDGGMGTYFRMQVMGVICIGIAMAVAVGLHSAGLIPPTWLAALTAGGGGAVLTASALCLMFYRTDAMERLCGRVASKLVSRSSPR